MLGHGRYYWPGDGTPASVFDRSYIYDNMAKVMAIAANKSAANNESFGYDHRDRCRMGQLGLVPKYPLKPLAESIRAGGCRTDTVCHRVNVGRDSTTVDTYNRPMHRRPRTNNNMALGVGG